MAMQYFMYIILMSQFWTKKWPCVPGYPHWFCYLVGTGWNHIVTPRATCQPPFPSPPSPAFHLLGSSSTNTLVPAYSSREDKKKRIFLGKYQTSTSLLIKPLTLPHAAANASWADHKKKHYETNLFVSNKPALVFVECKAKVDKSI